MSKKILIVDDDSNMRNSIRRLLLLKADYIIDEAEDGNVAREKILEFKPHLVVLDIKMPKSGGYEVIWSLKEAIAENSVKVIAMTGVSGTIGSTIMDMMGADAFFNKPFEPEKFTNTVELLLGALG